MMLAGFLLCSRIGCSESRDVWISFSAMPLSFSDASTAVISLALADIASRAVLAWLETPACRIAVSGALLMLASPVTETDGSFCSDCARAESGRVRRTTRRPRRNSNEWVMVIFVFIFMGRT